MAAVWAWSMLTPSSRIRSRSSCVISLHGLAIGIAYCLREFVGIENSALGLDFVEGDKDVAVGWGVAC